eukprot:g2331.t1
MNEYQGQVGFIEKVQKGMNVVVKFKLKTLDGKVVKRSIKKDCFVVLFQPDSPTTKYMQYFYANKDCWAGPMDSKESELCLGSTGIEMERLDVSGIVKMLRQIPRLKKTGEYAQFFYRGIQPTVFIDRLDSSKGSIGQY